MFVPVYRLIRESVVLHVKQAVVRRLSGGDSRGHTANNCLMIIRMSYMCTCVDTQTNISKRCSRMF